jgi:hypothetical protein
MTIAEWTLCSEEDCGGAAIAEGSVCLAHLGESELTTELQRVRTRRRLDARGVRIGEDLLDRIIAAVRLVESGKPVPWTGMFTKAQFPEGASFQGAALGGGTTFEGVTFGDRTTFEGATLEARTGFEGATFEAESVFDHAMFGDQTTFIGAIFKRWTTFEGATFGIRTSFLKVTFAAGTAFDGATFGEAINFYGAIFGEASSFLQANFADAANFEIATFEFGTKFDGAIFGDRTTFDRATFGDQTSFKGVTFGNQVTCENTTFGDRTDFTNATFRDEAILRGVKFGDSISFVEAILGDGSSFEETIFGDWASFSRATFGEGTRFAGAAFGDEAGFPGSTFGDWTSFVKATFGQRIGFQRTIFGDGTDFAGATFGDFTWLDIVASGSVVFDAAVFGQAPFFAITANELSFTDAHLITGGTISVRWAETTLNGTSFGGPAVVAAIAEPSPVDDSMAALAATSRTERPRILSVAGTDVSNLSLDGVDMRACRFHGAFNLDQLRGEGRYAFARSPAGWRFGWGWPPMWRWTNRRVIAEESEWRFETEREIRRGGWYEDECRPNASLGSLDDATTYPEPKIDAAEQTQRSDEAEGRPRPSREIEGLYRALRKGREDSKDEPGAADFYYGEMEMRRKGVPYGFERAILFSYWLVSGYGLRASRAISCLALTIVVFALLLMWFAFPSDGSFVRSLLFSIESTVSLLRAPTERLTTVGRFLEIPLRLLGPLFFGLALLSLRGRVKR